MMKTPTEFDFSTVGKQMPYRVPEGFFEQSERQLKAAVQSQSGRRKVSRRWWYAAAAIMLLLLAVYPVTRLLQRSDRSEVAVYCQTDGTSEDWDGFADADLFLENMDW